MSTRRRPLQINPKRVAWEFSNTRKFWFDDSPVLSNLMNVYSLLVPENESYYIRSIKAVSDRLNDPQLESDVFHFIRQESLHGVAHRAHWTRLSALGVKVERFVNWTNILLYRVLEPLQPNAVRVSIVAAIEHVNAALGNVFLEKELLDVADPEFQRLYGWHFAEEIGHKAVAHEVLTKLYPGYWTRAAGGLLAFPLFFFLLFFGAAVLLAEDGQLMQRRHLREMRAFLFGKGVARAVMGHLTRYFRRDFEPWGLDDRHLMARFAPDTAPLADLPSRLRAAG